MYPWRHVDEAVRRSHSFMFIIEVLDEAAFHQHCSACALIGEPFFEMEFFDLSGVLYSDLYVLPLKGLFLHFFH